MPSIQLLGQVLPAPVQVSVSDLDLVTWEAPELNLSMKFQQRIVHSAIHVACDLNRWGDEVLPTVFKHALDLCRASVDLVGFSMGWGLTVHLHSFVDPDGNVSALLFQAPGLSPLCTAYNVSEGFGEIHRMVLQEPTLMHALNDLVQAITVPHKSLVNCARAMDRLKHLVAPAGATKKDAWAALQSALRIEEDYLKVITAASANPRHGGLTHVPGTMVRDVTSRAWTVMNRYLEYRKAGGVLPVAFGQLR